MQSRVDSPEGTTPGNPNGARRIGIFNLNLAAMGGGEKRTLVLAEHLSRSARVSLIVAEPPDVARLERFFGVDLSGIAIVCLGETAGDSQRCHRILRDLDFDLFINNSYQSELRCPAERGIYMCMFPHDLGISRKPLGHLRSPSTIGRGGPGALALASYSRVTANSRFTRKWIKRMWRRRADLVYSPCDNAGPPLPKEKIIVHVGRFMAEDSSGHHKQQHVLVSAFRRMTFLADAGWQLHLAGAVDPGEKSASYLARLIREAAGSAISFHPDVELETLRSLYRRASIYWHATGFGFPETEYPARQEHFGVTTVEAMSAGAVPVVFRSGGPRETVRHGWNGLLWKDGEDLERCTRWLVADPRRIGRLGRRAQSSSARFSRAAFLREMDAVLARA